MGTFHYTGTRLFFMVISRHRHLYHMEWIHPTMRGYLLLLLFLLHTTEEGQTHTLRSFAPKNEAIASAYIKSRGSWKRERTFRFQTQS